MNSEVRILTCQCSAELAIMVVMNSPDEIRMIETHPDSTRWYARFTKHKRRLNSWLKSYVFCKVCDRRHQIRTFKTYVADPKEAV